MEDGVFTASQWINRPLKEVFAFFADEKNLERITPPMLKFQVLGKSTPQIQNGTVIDYRLKIRGIPCRWQSRIEQWNEGKSFVDVQLKGPYAKWHHTHTFTAKEGGTLMEDRVLYRLPGGRIGGWLAGWLVRRDVEAIFAYRRKIISEMFS